MDYQSIEAFLSIVETGSLSKAAESLYLSQPALTHRLQKLEEELKKDLFIRSKGVRLSRLTSYGEQFIKIAEQWHRAKMETDRFISTDEHFFLRLAGVDSLNSYVFPGFFQKLADQSAGLHVSTHQSNEIYTLVDERKIDVGFTLQESQMKNIICTPIFQEKMYFVQNSTYNTPQNTVHPSVLEPAKEVYLHWSNEFREWHEHWFSPYSFPMIQIDTISLMEQFLQSNDCWAIIPASVLSKFELNSDIYSCDVSDGPPNRVCDMVTNRLNPITSQYWYTVFINALNEFIKNNSSILLPVSDEPSIVSHP